MLLQCNINEFAFVLFRVAIFLLHNHRYENRNPLLRSMVYGKPNKNKETASSRWGLFM